MRFRQVSDLLANASWLFLLCCAFSNCFLTSFFRDALRLDDFGEPAAEIFEDLVGGAQSCPAGTDGPGFFASPIWRSKSSPWFLKLAVSGLQGLCAIYGGLLCGQCRIGLCFGSLLLTLRFVLLLLICGVIRGLLGTIKPAFPSRNENVPELLWAVQ